MPVAAVRPLGIEYISSQSMMAHMGMSLGSTHTTLLAGLLVGDDVSLCNLGGGAPPWWDGEAWGRPVACGGRTLERTHVGELGLR